MKNKSISLMFVLLGLLSIFVIGFASAATIGSIDITSIPASVTQDQGSFSITFNITNSGAAGDVDLTLTLTTGIGTGSVTSPQTFAAGESKTVTGTINFNAGQSGVIAGKLIADPVGAGSPVEKTFSVNILDSSSLEIKKVQDITLQQDGKITLRNTGNKDLNLQLTSSGEFDVSLIPTSVTLLANSNPANVTVIPTTDLSTLKFGSHTVTITATDSVRAVQSSTTVNFMKSFCRSGAAGGNLTIDRVKISSSGDDDDEWKLLDSVDVEVKVANDGNADIKDVFVELGLFDSQGRNQISDLDFENTDEEKINAGRIRDGDDTTVTFSFKVPADFEDGSYKLAVKAFSDDLGEKVECTDVSDDLSDSTFESIDVIREDSEGKFIAFDNIKVTPDQATCGDTVTVTTDVVNVGDEDQDQVKVNLLSKELGISQLESVIRDDLNQGDKKQVTFTFAVPNGLQDKLYRLQLNANYDYRNGVYRESSDDPTEFTLRVLGCSNVPQGRIALITASLGSDAKAGKPLTVKATITSAISGENDFVIRPTGFESWATLGSISDRIVHLNEGESKDVTLTFNVNNDAEGEQSFTLEAIAGGKTEPQEISVSIAGGAQGPGFNLGDNGLIWIIGIINVILIILIIIVAIRVSRR